MFIHLLNVYQLPDTMCLGLKQDLSTSWGGPQGDRPLCGFPRDAIQSTTHWVAGNNQKTILLQFQRPESVDRAMIALGEAPSCLLQL